MSFENYPNFKRYYAKNILAVDYGTRATGLATFCPGREPFPMPFGKIVYKDDLQLISEIIKVVHDESIDLVILGLPHLLDGKETDATRKIKKFGEALQSSLKNVPLVFQDETLSTFEAEDRMKKSPRYNFKIDPKEIDALAASIILEDFIRA